MSNTRKWPVIINAVSLLLILAFGFTIRFYGLTQVPPALWWDEAFYGVHAAESLLNHDYEIVYYRANEGQPGLFIWIVAAFFYVEGETLYALRSASALIGSLTVIAAYGLARELWRGHQQRYIIALIVAFLLASSFWHLIFSRIAFSVGLAILFETLALWLTMLAVRHSSLWFTLAAGSITGAGFYSYWQYYPYAAIPIGLMALHAWKTREWRKPAVFLLTVLMLAFPLIYTCLHEDIFVRVRRFFILNARHDSNDYLLFLKQVASNALSTIGMLFFNGDTNWRHNYNAKPELSTVETAGVIAACCYGLYSWRQSSSFHSKVAWYSYRFNLLIIWILLGMLPGIIAYGGIPHASRTVSMVVPLEMLAGYGLYETARLILAWSKCYVRTLLRYRITAMLVALLVIVHVYGIIHTYFDLYGNNPKTLQFFKSNLTECRQYLFCQD